MAPLDRDPPQPVSDLLLRAWCWNWFESKLALPLFALLGIGYFSLVAIIGSGPISTYGNDIFLFLDGGWRLYSGQIPYRDFYLSLGPLEYMLTAAGMWLTSAKPDSIAVGNILFGLTLAPTAFYIGRSRMPSVPTILTTAWITLLGTLPAPIGSSTQDIGYAMIFNRHGYALLSLLMVECLLAPESDSVWGGVVTGIATGCLAFLKLNFFGVALGFVALSLVMRPAEKKRLLGAAGAFALVAVAFSAYLHFAIPAMIADLAATIKARSSGIVLTGPILLHDLLRDETTVLAAISLACALLFVQRKTWFADLFRYVAPLALVIAAGLALIKTNTDETAFPLHISWLLILLGGVTKRCLNDPAAKTALLMLVLAAAGLLAVPVGKDALTLVTVMRYGFSPRLNREAARLDAPGMQRIRFYDRTGAEKSGNGHPLVNHVDEGLTLLSKDTGPQDKILVLGFYNPFTYTLRRKPCRGGSTWLDKGNNIADGVCPTASRMFGDAEVVMVPEYPGEEPTVRLLLATYGDYLASHYELKGKSASWTLYRRKSIPGSQSTPAVIN